MLRERNVGTAGGCWSIFRFFCISYVRHGRSILGLMIMILLSFLLNSNFEVFS